MNNTLTGSKDHIVNPDIIGKKTLQTISQAKRFNQWMYSTIHPFIKGNVLEIGAGIGNISNLIIKDGFTVSLSDYNNDYCNDLKQNFSTTPNVKEILQIDLLLPDFENRFSSIKQNFDTIVLLNVIEHLENDAQAIKNCNFLLKRKGQLIVLAPAYKWLYCNLDKQLGHYRRYSIGKMKSVLEKNDFAVISGKHFNLLGITGWFIFGKIFRKKMIGKEMNSFEKLVPLAKFIDNLTFKKIGLSVITIGIKE